MMTKLPLIALGYGVMAGFAAPAQSHDIPFAPSHGKGAAFLRLNDPAFAPAVRHRGQTGAAPGFTHHPSPDLHQAPARSLR